jgi:hypothetical protein
VAITFSAVASASTDEVAKLAALAAAPDRWRSMIEHGLRTGTTRAQWLWRVDDGDELVAAAVWWSAGSDAAPELVDVLGGRTAAAVAGVLLRSRAAVGARSALCSVQVDGRAARLEDARPALATGLRSAGFSPEVERVRVEWTAGSALPPPPGLAMRPAVSVDEADLIDLFAAVSDGSLDHSMIAERERIGRRAEAKSRLDAALCADDEPDWFTGGVDPAGALVGYVVPRSVGLAT